MTVNFQRAFFPPKTMTISRTIGQKKRGGGQAGEIKHNT